LQELFVETIAKDAYCCAQQGKRKTLQRRDLGRVAVVPQGGQGSYGLGFLIAVSQGIIEARGNLAFGLFVYLVTLPHV
jgi:hypothetical protein